MPGKVRPLSELVSKGTNNPALHAGLASEGDTQGDAFDRDGPIEPRCKLLEEIVIFHRDKELVGELKETLLFLFSKALDGDDGACRDLVPAG